MSERGTLARAAAADDPSVASEQEAIADWLLQGPAQVRTGAHAGAVAGTVDASGNPVYAYPEITGYYLQWLAWRAARYGHASELAPRAAAAQRWLSRWLDAGPRPLATRVDLGGAGDDWRNGALFCFDLAMVLRGLGTAASANLIVPDPVVVAGLCRQLERLVAADGAFDACVTLMPGATLPQRWSTRRGGFLAKAGAGILSAAAALPGVTATVVAAARQTVATSLRSVIESPHDDVHPLLYTFEGVLALPEPVMRPVLAEVAAQFNSLLDDARAQGRIPESRRQRAAADGPERLDVVAQTIRVGHLLGAHRSQNPPDRIGLARLRQMLVAHTAPNGALPFAAGMRAVSYNVWAAMFAEQALGFVPQADDPDSAFELGRLIV